MSGSRSAHRRVVPSAAAAVLAACLLAGLLPVPTAVAGGPETGAIPGAQPSIAYLEAMAHEGDDLAFEPGDRVEIPFRPRVGDRWPVGGRAPVALPAGRVTGREMAATATGVTWTPRARDGAAPGDPAIPGASDAPVDAPAGGVPLRATRAAWTEPAAGPATVDAASGMRRQVFGFLPYWELTNATGKLDLDVLSTIAYFSVGATAKGDLRKRDRDGTATTGWGGWTSSSMTKVINAAHRRGTRVVLTVSVFAWTSAQADVQRSILGSAAARRNLARQAAAAVRDRGADGINLDFEPLASGYEDGFVALLHAVRDELDGLGRGYQLTYDTTGYIGNYPLEASVGRGAADAVFVMGYDYRTAGSGQAGSIDPLRGPKYDLTDTVRLYTQRIPASRVILGLPWYGRAWSTTGSGVRATTQSGLKYGSSTAVNYESLPGLVRRHGRRWDAREASPYLVYRRENCTGTHGCVTSWRQVYYDDKASFAARLQLVDDYGLRGAGVWALGYDGDNPELFRALRQAFLLDVAAPRAGIRVLDGTQADEGFTVRWSATDTSRITGYDVQVSRDGGAWTTWHARTTATSDVWLGADGATYAFRVRARDAKGNTGAWNVTSRWEGSPSLAKGGFGRVVTDGLSYRAGPDTSAARLGGLDAGTIVAITSGPVRADGYTWYEVTQPVREWNPVTFVERGVWVAAGSSSATHVVAHRAPNSTRVAAGLVGFDFGSGASGVGTGSAAVAARTFSPNGDGSRDTLRLRWTNAARMDDLELRVYRPDGTYLGAQAVSATGAGARTWDWNGRVAGRAVADGRYVLRLVGRADGTTYSAPSARPTTATQVARYAVTIDRTAAALAWSRSFFPQDGDRLRPDATLSWHLRRDATTTLRLYDADGDLVRTAWSGREQRAGDRGWTWNGRLGDGSMAPQGRYTARLTVTSRYGTAVLSRTVVAAAFAVSPSATRVSPGDRLVIRFSTVEALDTQPVVTVRQPGRRAVRVTATRADDGTYRASFRVASGGAGEATVRISATDAAGARNTTVTTVRVRAR